jgi:hypothetical protein
MSKSRAPFLKSAAPAEEVALALHSEEGHALHEEDVSWVRWTFQSIRARRPGIVFETEATERAQLIDDWKRFVEQTWLPSIAPLLLRGWAAAREGREEELFLVNAKMGAALSPEEQERSVIAGQMLLKATQGAKYQSSLGAFRRYIEQTGAAPQLAGVWAALAALFQLPPSDVLIEHLREEWLVATKHCAHHEPPHGPVSFTGLAARALHESRHFQFAEQEES